MWSIICTIGAAIRQSATQNSGQLNQTGNNFRKLFTPCPATPIASAINKYKASITPTKFSAHPFQAENPGSVMFQPLASVPHKIISSAMLTGANTGPHHGSGNRNKMSQSSNDRGQPQMTFRKA